MKPDPPTETVTMLVNPPDEEKAVVMVAEAKAVQVLEPIVMVVDAAHGRNDAPALRVVPTVDPLARLPM